MRLALVVVTIVSILLLVRPQLGLPLIILCALVVRTEFGTRTEVSLNVVTLLIPALLALWFLAMITRRDIALKPSPVNRPLLLFLVFGLVSLLVGIATWDPLVPRNPNFLLAQLAQWSIFAFSAGTFWLSANLIQDEKWLRIMVTVFLVVGGAGAIALSVPGISGVTADFVTVAYVRPPFWILLAALAVAQLLFNQSLRPFMRLGLALILVATAYYAFGQQQEAASNWVGITVAIAVLVWLRYPRLRLPISLVLLALAIGGILFPSLYDFAGGDQEWRISGGSRIALIQRVVEVTMRNPITGLGPAAYRPYANVEPLAYGRAYWLAPQVNSHNNYVDLFAHVGVIGLGLFAWFAFELARLGLRLRRRYRDGFSGAFVTAGLAVGAASLVLMLLADWILPFVYNIGFTGFQASVLVWLFMGGLVALDNLPASTGKPERVL